MAELWIEWKLVQNVEMEPGSTQALRAGSSRVDSQ
jgi:hypothetical protein